MHFITLDSETDFEGWRKAARALALNDVKPDRRDMDACEATRPNCSNRPTTRRCRSRRTAPSTSRPNSSNWRKPRSCTATPNASPCSIACCGGCAAITIC